MHSEIKAVGFQIDRDTEQVTHHCFDIYIIWWENCLTSLLSECLEFYYAKLFLSRILIYLLFSCMCAECEIIAGHIKCFMDIISCELSPSTYLSSTCP
jgi:hypothetical protein